MKARQKRAIIKLSNVGYVIGCVILYIISIGIIVMAIASVIQDLRAGSFTVYRLLDEVGLIVFSIAVIDVAKYLMVEEVLREREEKHPAESRKTLTKFAVIIATALSLEGLVLTIETAKQEISLMIYPVTLLVTAILFIVGIGIYQRLNATAEKQ